MINFDEKSQKTLSKKTTNEIKLKARAVSRGIAIGKLVSLHGSKRQFYRTELKKSQIETELRRFHAALRLAKRQLKKIEAQKSALIGKNKSKIFDAHLLFLEDKSFLTRIEENIQKDKVNAEWAVKSVADIYVAQYKSIADEHLRERYIDLEDVAERLLTALGGGRRANIHFDENSIIVAREVRPSTLIELAENKPKGVITENGGWTSHTFILAREMNLPAVTGLKGILRAVENGDKAIVDGYSGLVILRPSAGTLKEYTAAAAEFQNINRFEADESKGNLKTLDGHSITIRANLDFPEGYAKAKNHSAKGVGLFRTEYLFNQFKGFPSEQEQIKEYRNIGKLVGDEGVRIRTFDLSAEQFSANGNEKEKNPALGLRAIRLSLRRKKQFQIQIRALLESSADYKIDIILPMISDVSEIRRAKKIIEQEKANLAKKGILFGNPRLGVMIEVPAAVFIVEDIAREVDFLCLGTNDLVQYLLAVDRDNETVSDWFKTLHPAVLRAIKKVLQAAEKCEIPAVVCGEMAGSPYYVPLLIGLGATELSMNINSIARVRKTISGIAFEEAFEIIKKLEKCPTSEEVETAVGDWFAQKWSHLLSKEILPEAGSGKSPQKSKKI